MQTTHTRAFPMTIDRQPAAGRTAEAGHGAGETERLPYTATELARAYDRLGALPACVLLDNVRSLYNVGAFFRTADGVRLECLWLGGITPRPPRREITKTALGAEHCVRWEPCPDAVAQVEALRARGYEIAGVETSLRAVDVFDWRPRFPVCVLFGHEVDGIRPDLIDRCDTLVRIPMLGRKESLNVATAGGVVLFELLRKYRSMKEMTYGFRL